MTVLDVTHFPGGQVHVYVDMAGTIDEADAVLHHALAVLHDRVGGGGVTAATSHPRHVAERVDL